MCRLSTRLDPAMRCASAVPTGAPVAASLKVHAQRISRLRPRPSKDIFAGLERNSADADRRLHNQIVRILALGGVAGCQQHHSGDEAAAAVHDAGGGAHLGLNVLLFHLRARRQQRRKLRICGLPPRRFLRLCKRRQKQQKNSGKNQLFGQFLVHGFGFLRDSRVTMPR